MTLPPAIGAHVDQTDPIAEAQARGTTVVQFFLGDPQGYKGPEIAYAGGAAALVLSALVVAGSVLVTTALVRPWLVAAVDPAHLRTE